jgi:dsDNA-binding SOS-regulon protein
MTHQETQSDSKPTKPFNWSIGLLENTTVQLYKRLTPERIQEVLKDNKLALQGLDCLHSARRLSQPLVDRLDSCLSPMLDWLLGQYQLHLCQTVQRVSSTVKEFYSAEKNDYARITLRFLTLAIPQPESVRRADFTAFKAFFQYDPQYAQEAFQRILKAFHAIARKSWDISKTSTPLEIIQKVLSIVATTMEDTLISKGNRLADFAQEAVDYFIHEHRNLHCFSRVTFRNYLLEKFELETLDAEQLKFSEQFLQIARMLFEISHMTNQDLISKLAAGIKEIKAFISGFTTEAKDKLASVAEFVLSSIPRDQLLLAFNKATATGVVYLTKGKEEIVVQWNAFRESQAVQHCLEIAQAVDEYLRENGKALVQHYKDNAEALAKFVVQNREAILKFSLFYCEKAGKYTHEQVERLREMLGKVTLNAIDVLKFIKDAGETLYDVTAEYSIYYKEKLLDYALANYKFVLEEGREKLKIVLEVVRLHQLVSLIGQTVRKVDEYLCIKESLNRVDLLTNDRLRHLADENEKLLLTRSALEVPSY